MSDEPRWVIWRKNLESKEREVHLDTYATEAEASARSNELDDEKPGYLHWIAREDEWDVPTPDRRTVGDELTDERLEQLQYALNQYEPDPERELTLDELRPPMSDRALERMRWCAGLLKWARQWDFGDEFGGQLDMLPTMNLAATREAQEALLDEIDRLREAHQTIENDLENIAAAARGLHDAVVAAQLHIGVSYEISAACQEVMDRTISEDGDLWRQESESLTTDERKRTSFQDYVRQVEDRSTPEELASLEAFRASHRDDVNDENLDQLRSLADSWADEGTAEAHFQADLLRSLVADVERLRQMRPGDTEGFTRNELVGLQAAARVTLNHDEEHLSHQNALRAVIRLVDQLQSVRTPTISDELTDELDRLRREQAEDREDMRLLRDALQRRNRTLSRLRDEGADVEAAARAVNSELRIERSTMREAIEHIIDDLVDDGGEY